MSKQYKKRNTTKKENTLMSKHFTKRLTKLDQKLTKNSNLNKNTNIIKNIKIK